MNSFYLVSLLFITVFILCSFLKTKCMPAAGWCVSGFLKLFFSRKSVCVPVCLLLIASGVIWNPYDWLNRFYSCYMANVISIVSR